jgi:hypothetical protein
VYSNYTVINFPANADHPANSTEQPPTTTITYPTPTAKSAPTTTTTNPTLSTTNSTMATTVYSNYTVINFPGNADHPTNADHPAKVHGEAPTGKISTEKWVNDSVKWCLELIVPVLTVIAFSLGICRWCCRGTKASHQNPDRRYGTIDGGGGGGGGAGDVENGRGGGGNAEVNGGGGGEPNVFEIAEVLEGVAN